MRLLLDTHALLWFLDGDERLGRQARDAIMDESNEVLVSAVSLFEMAVKVRIGKLRLELAAVIARLDQFAFERLEIDDRHVVGMSVLKVVEGHRDPFDLMLVAQAIADDLTMVTDDAALAKYPVAIIRCAGRS